MGSHKSEMEKRKKIARTQILGQKIAQKSVIRDKAAFAKKQHKFNKDQSCIAWLHIDMGVFYSYGSSKLMIDTGLMT